MAGCRIRLFSRQVFIHLGGGRFQAIYEVGTKKDAFKYRALQTVGGLKRYDLKRNKRGKIVSAHKSAMGMKAVQNLKGWTLAVQRAKKDLKLTGFVLVKKGTALYKRAREHYGIIKAHEYGIRKHVNVWGIILAFC